MLDDRYADYQMQQKGIYEIWQKRGMKWIFVSRARAGRLSSKPAPYIHVIFYTIQAIFGLLDSPLLKECLLQMK